MARFLRTKYVIDARNDTDKELYVYGTYTNCDTLLPQELPFLERLVPSENLTHSPYSDIMWVPFDWSDDPSAIDTIRLFFFENKVFEENDWSVICRDYLMLHRYDLSKDDLDRLDWRMAYPPREDMKNVRMWPSMTT